MEPFQFDNNVSFDELKKQIEALQTQYQEFLASFSYFHKKQMLIAKKEIKKQVFSYNEISGWKLERLWECLNGDFETKKFKNLK